MEDNSSSDDEVQDSTLSPKLGGKKLKLNDGSSQDSLKDSGSSTRVEKDENVDSGISGVSADKSESTSSEDRGTATTEGPSNEVVNVAPSSSNIHTILLNFRRPRLARNYRKRKTPDRDSDSNDNDSSPDSDDLSAEESPPEYQLDESLDAESEVLEPWVTDSGSNSSSDEQSYITDDMGLMQSGDTDTDEDAEWNRSGDDNKDDSEEAQKLLKPRPKHNYLILREIINREMGLTFPVGKATKADVMYEHKFYGSLHSVYRLKKLYNLNKHRGCVNAINFHPEGELLASGSDDTQVVVWAWARGRPLCALRSEHKSNVFQAKFLHLNARSQLNIVTCARDGNVRLLQCPPSGGAGAVTSRRLGAHSRAAHKLHVSALEPHVVLSCGEDGVLLQCDVRADKPTKVLTVKEASTAVPLYSVCGHPLEQHQLALAGRDKFVRVYDRRRPAAVLCRYCPSSFHRPHSADSRRKIPQMMHLTCAVYSHDGSELLGSYNDEDIYLFDTKHDAYDKEKPEKDGFTHRYSGHRNSATFKGVAFFGPRSQYVVSGSDCANIYVWEKHSEAIVQWMPGDVNGVVNCIEAHPRFPVLATSGLDKDVKIWVPRNHKEPTFDGLARVVRENVASQGRSILFNDFLPSIYSAWRRGSREPPHHNIEFDGNVCSAF